MCVCVCVFVFVFIMGVSVNESEFIYEIKIRANVFPWIQICITWTNDLYSGYAYANH